MFAAESSKNNNELFCKQHCLTCAQAAGIPWNVKCWVVLDFIFVLILLPVLLWNCFVFENSVGLPPVLCSHMVSVFLSPHTCLLSAITLPCNPSCFLSDLHLTYRSGNPVLACLLLLTNFWLVSLLLPVFQYVSALVFWLLALKHFVVLRCCFCLVSLKLFVFFTCLPVICWLRLSPPFNSNRERKAHTSANALFY